MARPSKIVDASEVKRWIEEGRTYAWMVEEYARKYDIEMSIGAFSTFRYRHGMPRRIPRDVNLIPWKVKDEHSNGYPLWVLRTESRIRGEFEVGSTRLRRLEAWKARMSADGVVIHYDPDTEQGWFLVPRREGVDLDLIREPDKGAAVRK